MLKQTLRIYGPFPVFREHDVHSDALEGMAYGYGVAGSHLK